MNKRYYWLKLKTDFFDQKEIRMLRKIAGGDTYTIIYLKMLLSSLKDEGKLYFESIGDDFTEEIALLIDEDIENVAITIEFLKSKNLIEIIESDEFFLSRVPEMVGSEAYSTERSRRHRSIKKQQKALQCNNDATDCNVMQLRDREEKEKELEINTLSSSDELDHTPYKEIIDYLNEKAGTKYKASTKKTRTLILARSKEGFTLEDFKKAIDNKVSEWIDNPDMVKFLRPETLFGTKFEGYLNQKKVVKKAFGYERDEVETDLPF